MTLQTTHTKLTFRGACAEDRDEILDVLEQTWPGGEYEETFLSSAVWFAWEQYRLSILDGKIVGMLKVHPRRIIWGNSVVRMAGIGEVLTLPDHKKKGYGSELLQDTVKYMTLTGYELSVLFSELHSFYVRSGWELVAQPEFNAVVEPVDVSNDGEYTTRGFDLKTDLGKVAEVYSKYNRNQTGAVLRPINYWRKQFSWSAEDMKAFTVAMKGNKVVAYFRATHQNDSLTITECAHLPGCETSVRSLGIRAIELAQGYGCEKFILDLPSGNPMVSELEQLGLKVLSGKREVLMLQPLNLESLGVKLGRGSFTSASEFFSELPQFNFCRQDAF